jgi:sugar phosphate isomerase/epimerase
MVLFYPNRKVQIVNPQWNLVFSLTCRRAIVKDANNITGEAMELKIFKSLWGMTHDLEGNLKRISDAGYRGVEMEMQNVSDASRVLDLLHLYNLEIIPTILTEGKNTREHIQSFAEQLERSLALKPVLVNSHSSRDFMSLDEQRQFFHEALDMEVQSGVRVAHETHRSRALSTPWRTAQLLQEFETLKINADFSHWCCVCESLLADQADTLALASERAVHIHARVGYEQGPQVPDPRAPEYVEALEAHEHWWKNIIRARSRDGFDIFTITPEFGPPLYMHTIPYTGEAVADLWVICQWMAERFKQYA